MYIGIRKITKLLNNITYDINVDFIYLLMVSNDIFLSINIEVFSMILYKNIEKKNIADIIN